MRIGVLRIYLQIPDSHSLKEKRRVVRSLKDRLMSNFNISVAEVGSNDKLQVAELGLVTVGTDKPFVEQLLDRVVDFIEERGEDIVVLEADIEIL
jgi:uncharacterized protein YlxP (DUF503 family)